MYITPSQITAMISTKVYQFIRWQHLNLGFTWTNFGV